MERIKQELKQVRPKKVIQVFLIGLIGYIIGVASVFYAMYK